MKTTKNLYENISNKELPSLLRICYEENGNDMERAAQDIETIDVALGLIKSRTLINARARKTKVNRWSTDRNFKGIMENLLMQNIEKKGGKE